MRIEQSTRDGCTIITLTGHLDRAAAPYIQQLLLRRLREQPIAVICDLSEVWTLDPASASVFATTAHHPASGWIAPKLLLCCAQPAIATMLARLPAPHQLPIHHSVEDAIHHSVEDAIHQAFEDAIDQVLNHPLWLRHELELAPSPTAPAAARRFVRALCTSWDLNLAADPADPAERAWLADRVDQAVLVTSELVTNAVVHAHSELRLLVELRGDQLHLAVQDASPHLLHLATSPDVLEEGGRGLLLVEALASTWQVQHPLDGGKVVACVLDLAH